MSYAFNRIIGLKVELCPCPFCGGTAEWIEVPGSDYIMRCSNCHASTLEAQQVPEAAAADWNARNIVDDNFTITSDTKIDEYLKCGIKKVLFAGRYDYDYLPVIENGFLCRNAMIVTDKIILGIRPDRSHLLYDEFGGYSAELYKNYFVPEGTEIEFLKSRWRKRSLLSLEFICGDIHFSIAPGGKKWNQLVCKSERREQ